MKAAQRLQRPLWAAVLLLAVIGIAVVIRRTVTLVPILLDGYRPPAATSNPVAAQFAALDDLFARYPSLTLIHILPGLLFMILGPLQFSATLRALHPRWHRWSGRVYCARLEPTKPNLVHRLVTWTWAVKRPACRRQ